ncbi:MAG TPA: hypothetical protein VNT79_11885 [Phycisphaerae bacterium]|nr:hypothetical protein [Phycisphaerae bacterium]
MSFAKPTNETESDETSTVPSGASREAAFYREESRKARTAMKASLHRAGHLIERSKPGEFVRKHPWLVAGCLLGATSVVIAAAWMTRDKQAVENPPPKKRRHGLFFAVVKLSLKYLFASVASRAVVEPAVAGMQSGGIAVPPGEIESE